MSPRRGRNKRGIHIGIHPTLSPRCTITTINEISVIVNIAPEPHVTACRALPQTNLLFIYVPPKMNRLSLQRISDLIRTLCSQNLTTIILGDLNGRIAVQQQVPPFQITNGKLYKRRTSVDNVTNQQGQLVLNMCQENKLLILNGRTEGDPTGAATYIAAQGTTVLDLVLANELSKPYLTNFEIRLDPSSDHMPCMTTLLDTSNFQQPRLN